MNICSGIVLKLRENGIWFPICRGKETTKRIRLIGAVRTSYSHDPVSRQILNSFLAVLCDVNFMNQHQYDKAYFSSLIACSANSSTLSKLRRSKIHKSTQDEVDDCRMHRIASSLQLVR